MDDHIMIGRELARALNILVGRTKHERFRQLCDPRHPDFQPGAPALVFQLAGMDVPKAYVSPVPEAAAHAHAHAETEWPAGSLMATSLSPEERKRWRALVWGCPARNPCNCTTTRCHNDVMGPRFGRAEPRSAGPAYLVSEVDCMACIATFDRGLMPPRDRDTTGLPHL